jgi:hypothetical protein
VIIHHVASGVSGVIRLTDGIHAEVRQIVAQLLEMFWSHNFVAVVIPPNLMARLT